MFQEETTVVSELISRRKDVEDMLNRMLKISDSEKKLKNQIYVLFIKKKTKKYQ